MNEPLDMKGFVNKLFAAEIEPPPEKTPEQRIFELECHVSMLSDFVFQLVGELRKQGLSISDTLKDFDEEE